jgi:hypothetical protein
VEEREGRPVHALPPPPAAARQVRVSLSRGGGGGGGAVHDGDGVPTRTVWRIGPPTLGPSGKAAWMRLASGGLGGTGTRATCSLGYHPSRAVRNTPYEGRPGLCCIDSPYWCPTQPTLGCLAAAELQQRRSRTPPSPSEGSRRTTRKQKLQLASGWIGLEPRRLIGRVELWTFTRVSREGLDTRCTEDLP